MRDYVGEMWDDILPHVLDELREGNFEMSYGIYGLDDLDISDEDVAYVWNELQVVPSYTERYAHSEDCQCWKCATVEMVAVPVVWMEDAPLHLVDSPFCSDPTCPCHNDAAHYEFVERSVLDGLLTTWEGSRLYWGEAI